jgi:putative endonuclease
MDDKLYYVYLIRSIKFPDQKYIGFTEDVPARIKEHNRGGSIHAGKYRPWKLVTYHAFTSKKQAKEFEKYLKSGSGRAFASKRLW